MRTATDVRSADEALEAAVGSLPRPGAGAAGRVVVALSGGVDSSVAAALLQRAGYAVVGLTLALGDEAPPGAAAVARHLGFRLLVRDCRRRFRTEVVRPFCRAYLAGRTPNPCVVCNPGVKFRALAEAAAESEARWLATGHYACIDDDAAGGRRLLRRGRDPTRDQSYVLYRLDQPLLARLLLPLGTVDKDAVRRLAADFGLPGAARADSQDVCFLPDGDYRPFVRRHHPEAQRPGPIVDHRGRQVGTHSGLVDYTVGQRRGLGLALGYPAYVIALRPETDTLVVGPATELEAAGLEARAPHFIPFDFLDSPLSVTVQVRYRSRPRPALLAPLGGASCGRGGGGVRVTFDRPVRAVTPGQAAVFYEASGGGLVIGGATIDRAISGGAV